MYQQHHQKWRTSAYTNKTPYINVFFFNELFNMLDKFDQLSIHPYIDASQMDGEHEPALFFIYLFAILGPKSIRNRCQSIEYVCIYIVWGTAPPPDLRFLCFRILCQFKGNNHMLLVMYGEGFFVSYGAQRRQAIAVRWW